MTAVQGIKPAQVKEPQPQEQSHQQDTLREVISPSIWAISGGIATGTIAMKSTKFAGSLTNKYIFQKMQSLKINGKQEGAILTAANKALTKMKLNKTGTQILLPTTSIDLMPQWASKGGIKKAIRNIINTMNGNMVANGQNALFSPSNNKVFIPPKGPLKLSVFHELGHAHNFHYSKIGKLLQKSRGLAILALPIALIALLKTQKAPGEKPTGAVDKATDFIKNNAGKLTFATFLPTLIEEGMASFKGGQIAKKLLGKGLAAKVLKFNKIAYLTYLAGAVTASLGIFAAVKVKDAIAGRQEIDFDKRFDLNGDGVLSPSEAEAKKTYLSGRVQERTNLFQQFDFNKDGKLGADEKAAMDAYIKAAENN